MVLSHCLTISKSNHRTTHDDETYERINNLEDSYINSKLKNEKRDLFHSKRNHKTHRDLEAIVLDKDTTKAAKGKAFWRKCRRLFFKDAKTTKRKPKTTKMTNGFDYTTENVIDAEMMMLHKAHKATGDKNEVKEEYGRNYKTDQAEDESDLYGDSKYRNKRHPKKFLKAFNHQDLDQPTISYEMRKITVQVPLDSNGQTTRKHYLKTRSIHPLRKVQNQVKKLNKPVMKIYAKNEKETTPDVTDKMYLMNPYKFKISNSPPKLESTREMEDYLRNVKSKTMHDKLLGYNEIIAHSVTEAMFRSDPFTQLTPTPLSKIISTNRNIDGRKTTDKYNERHFLTSRSDNEGTSISEKIYTVANEYENKIQSKLNQVYEKLKRRFNYKSQVSKPSPKIMEETNVNNAKAKTNNFVLINNKNLKRKRFDQKATRLPRKQHKISSTDVNEDKLVENKKFLSDSDSTVKEKKNTDLEMIEVLEQMLKKSHKSNVNYLISTAPEWTTKLKKKNQRKRNIFNTNARLAKSFQPTNDNKYDHLAKKIAYDDYVNGYKHYLNFQKRLNKDNFSNMVKFQAHMHHDVNDIGKYILNKIPQTPKRVEKRHLFEDPDLLDDMEVSTKTDENWFRKHFNILLDTNAPKKKFHSSQTVNLKPPIEVSTISSTKLTTNAPKSSSETTPITTQIESSKDGEKYPADAMDILSTDKGKLSFSS